MIENHTALSDQTYEFALTLTISQREQLYSSAQEAVISPLANKLFGFPWVNALKLKPNSIELTKEDWVDWEVLLEPLMGLINEHLSTLKAPIEENPEIKKSESNEETQQIEHFLKEQVNPSLAMHGGWAELKGYDNGTVMISLGGGCQGCGSSQSTISDGIETALKEQFSFVQRVADMTDHAAGANPYM